MVMSGLAYSSHKELMDPHRYVFTTIPCRGPCGKTQEITVQAPDLFRYHQGDFIQDCFPYLSAAEREMLFMSHICGSCFDAIFNEEDEEK